MAERQTIRLLTLTRLWLFSRYLYRLGEYRLMVPVSHRALGYGLAVFVPLWAVLRALDVSTGSTLGIFLYVTVPGLVVWWALNLVGEGARPHELVISWARYVWSAARAKPARPIRVAAHARVDSGRATRLRERTGRADASL